MSFRKPLIPSTLAMSAALVLSGCSGAADDASQSPSGQIQQAQSNWNGQNWNGQNWNGQNWNGQNWNGQNWNGMGWGGAGGTPGIDWYSIGWTGSSWAGNAWGGVGSAMDCTISTNNDSCTTLHNWVNHSDVDGNNVLDNNDKDQRLGAIGAWVACACPASVTIPFSDTHGYTSMNFQGSLGLAPTWCGSSGAAVPESEMQIVSACLMTKINMKGVHYPLSLRSTEAGTAVGVNENLVMSRALAQYWGNLWKPAHADYDTTSAPWSSTGNLIGSGGTWWNMERFSIARGNYGNGNVADYISDQLSLGRDCEVSTCGGHLEFLSGWAGHKQLGNLGAWDSSNPSTQYYQSVKNIMAAPDLKQPGDFQQNYVASSSGGTLLSSVSYRGNTWRTMEVYGPHAIPLENPFIPGTNTNAPYNFAWAQVEQGTIPSSQSGGCTNGLADCDGYINQPGLKLLGLTSSQRISINLTGNASNVSGDPGNPVSIAIRYSRPPVLSGCHYVGGDPVCKYLNSPGKLSISISNTQMLNPGFTLLTNPKTLFPSTGSDDVYATAYIYPIYPQDSISTIAGQTDHTSGVTYDTVRVMLSGTTTSAADAPNLDSAYFFDGPPPSTADCTGATTGTGACFAFAGPSTTVSAPLNQWNNVYNSPILPAGTYTFTLSNVSGSLGLSVFSAGSGPYTWPSCSQNNGVGVSSTCSVTLPASGYVYVSILGTANNGSSAPSATLSGRN